MREGLPILAWARVGEDVDALHAGGVCAGAGAGVDFTEVDLLACGTSVPEQLTPGLASLVHGELGGAPRRRALVQPPLMVSSNRCWRTWAT